MKIEIKMKKKKFLLIALMLMGTAHTTMAQQRKSTTKTAVRKTATKKTQAKKPAVASIPYVGPAEANGEIAFLGISLAESPATMKSQLLSKGMKIDFVEENEKNNIHLKGSIDGTAVRLSISISVDKSIFNLSVIDNKSYRLAQATVRFNALVKKMESIYGKGQYENNESEYKQYTIAVGKGELSVSMFNEDEMDGASGFYSVTVGFARKRY